MILILFCVIVAMLSRIFNDKIIIYNIISFFVFLTHFAILKNYFEKFFEICIAALKLFFLYYFIILFFRSQILTYVCHSQKMRYSRLKRLIFLIMLIHSRNHFNFIFL